MLTAKGTSFRFENFEVDLEARTLKRDRQIVRLNPKTFDLLAMLVSFAPEPVSEADLTQALWPGVPVEESNLGQHIFLLRRALSGAARGEKIIVAMPEQAYCFAATLQEISEPTEEAPRKAPITVAADEPPGPVTSLSTPRPTPRERKSTQQDGPQRSQHSRGTNPLPWLITALRSSRPTQYVLIAVGAVLIGAAVWAIVWPRLHPPSTRPIHLIVAGIQNATSDPEFDDSLRTALVADLRQSPHLVLAPEDRIVAALVKMNTGASPAVAAIPQQLCSQLHSDVYLTGELRRIGQKYLITLNIIECGRAQQLASTRGITDSPQHLLGILDRAALSLRAQLGEGRESIQHFGSPFFPPQYASMPALKAYADGVALALDGKSSEAHTLLRRAISIDANFAQAEEALGLLAWSISDRAEGASHLTRAHQLRDFANAYDRFNLEGRYSYLVTEDLQSALRNAREAAENYPSSPAFLTGLAELEDRAGKAALALDPARQALALDPDAPVAYEVLAAAQMHLGQFEEAAATCRRALSRSIDTPMIHSLLLQIAFQRLDQPGIDEQIAWGHGKPEEARMLVDQAMMEMAQGRVSSAQQLFTRALAGLRQQGDAADASQLEAALPRRLAELGLADSAQARLARIQHPADSLDPAVAWAELGETSRASSQLEQALSAHPSATLLQQLAAPQVRAAIAFNQHEPQQAIDALQMADAYDRASFDLPLMRGRAYLALHQPEQAEAEFHKILDHPGMEPLSQDYPLAQLGLARALAAEGKTAEAGFAYKIVLQIWKDADSDLPRLRDARAEYAHLNGVPTPAPARGRRR